jgi:hypothetical protein
LATTGDHQGHKDNGNLARHSVRHAIPSGWKIERLVPSTNGKHKPSPSMRGELPVHESFTNYIAVEQHNIDVFCCQNSRRHFPGGLSMRPNLIPHLPVAGPFDGDGR